MYKKINFKLRINESPMYPMFSVKGLVCSLCGTLQWKLFSVPDDSFLLQVIMVLVTALCDENALI